jgi:hypothetical protein
MQQKKCDVELDFQKHTQNTSVVAVFDGTERFSSDNQTQNSTSKVALSL